MRTLAYYLQIIVALALSLTGCRQMPDFPVPGDPMHGECSSCEEFLLNSRLHVIPSQNGLVSIWDEKAGWLAENLYPEWETEFPSDTLVLVQNQRGKYTYIHAVWGTYWINDAFDRAWPFSEGVAAVMKNKRVYFIDAHGQPSVGGFSFPWNGHYVDRPIFRNGACAAADEKRKCGVINLKGEWLIEPLYKDIQFLDEGILCEAPGIGILFSYDGTVINPCVIESVSRLTLKGKPLSVCIYEVNERVGLMDLEGRRLTEAVYVEIWAMTEHLFGGRLSDEKSAVVINTRGEVVRTKPLVRE